MMATPKEPPSSWTVLRSPAPAPILPGGRVPMMALEAGVTTRPMPDPMEPNATPTGR